MPDSQLSYNRLFPKLFQHNRHSRDSPTCSLLLLYSFILTASFIYLVYRSADFIAIIFRMHQAIRASGYASLPYLGPAIIS